MNAVGVTRRSFKKTVGLTAAASSQARPSTRAALTGSASTGKPALLDGTPVHQGS